MKALIDKGWIKATNFKNSNNKLAYSYLLTPSGIDAKARITARFLKRKIGEYEALKAEIEQLTAEVEKGGSISEHKPQLRDHGAERPSHEERSAGYLWEAAAPRGDDRRGPEGRDRPVNGRSRAGWVGFGPQAPSRDRGAECPSRKKSKSTGLLWEARSAGRWAHGSVTDSTSAPFPGSAQGPSLHTGAGLFGDHNYRAPSAPLL